MGERGRCIINSPECNSDLVAVSRRLSLCFAASPHLSQKGRDEKFRLKPALLRLERKGVLELIAADSVRPGQAAHVRLLVRP